jgi:hypothetical protein
MGIDPSGNQFSVVGMMITTAIMGGIGGVTGAVLGAAHGYMKNGLKGALEGAYNGFLTGLAVGLAVGAATYALAWYFYSIAAAEGLSMLGAWGSASLVTAVPLRVLAWNTYAEAVKRGDQVDQGFALLGVALGTLPYLNANPSFSATSYLATAARSLPFVKNLRNITSTEANIGTGGHGWEVAFDSWALAAEFTTANTVRMVRFLNTSSRTEGPWVTLLSEVQGKSPAAIQKHLALKDPVTEYTIVDVPAEVVMTMGQVGKQTAFGYEGNGGLQFRIKPGQTLDPSWFGPRNAIGSAFKHP